jgi:hypothetical protein
MPYCIYRRQELVRAPAAERLASRKRAARSRLHCESRVVAMPQKPPAQSPSHSSAARAAQESGRKSNISSRKLAKPLTPARPLSIVSIYQAAQIEIFLQSMTVDDALATAKGAEGMAEIKAPSRTRQRALQGVQQQTRLKRGNDAIVRVIGFSVAIAAIAPVTWSWKIALFLAIMFLVGIIMPAITRARRNPG